MTNLSFQVGQLVVLTWREFDHAPEYPPIGAIGEVIGFDPSDNTFEVLFSDHPWSADDPPWFMPPSWLRPVLDPDREYTNEEETTKERAL